MKMSNLFKYGVILLSFIICSETQPDNTKKTINLNNAKSIISELKIDGLNKEYSNCILDGLENKYGTDIIFSNENMKYISSELGLICKETYGTHKIKTPVNQKRPDELIAKKKLKIPNLIKLDIEGGELKFLEGSKKILKYKALRHLFIEVHFTKLNKLHGKNGVTKIIKSLKNSDFKIFWKDSSHLHAKKIYK